MRGGHLAGGVHSLLLSWLAAIEAGGELLGYQLSRQEFVLLFPFAFPQKECLFLLLTESV